MGGGEGRLLGTKSYILDTLSLSCQEGIWIDVSGMMISVGKSLVYRGVQVEFRCLQSEPWGTPKVRDQGGGRSKKRRMKRHNQ